MAKRMWGSKCIFCHILLVCMGSVMSDIPVISHEKLKESLAEHDLQFLKYILKVSRCLQVFMFCDE